MKQKTISLVIAVGIAVLVLSSIIVILSSSKPKHDPKKDYLRGVVVGARWTAYQFERTAENKAKCEQALVDAGDLKENLSEDLTFKCE